MISSSNSILPYAREATATESLSHFTLFVPGITALPLSLIGTSEYASDPSKLISSRQLFKKSVSAFISFKEDGSEILFKE
jgi:hypothetical protein